MNAALVHRGPDSGGIEVRESAGLAARRLAIIDLVTGDQPLTNEDGSVVVVQNGELYNYRELRTELVTAGHTFRTNGDTEVIAHLYEERGVRFPEALRGMFAAAVWDARRRRLVLARDRFGIKPLYYRSTRDGLSFASELKALLRQPDFSREIDLEAVEAFLAFSFVPAPLSIFRDARKLEPGSVLVWEADRAGEITIHRYARPKPLPSAELRGEDEESLATELRDRLRDSVRAHLIADVPVGVLLSGGLDSSALAALAAETTPRISTFTIGYEERSFDERPIARLLAERYGTDHHELVVRPDVVELVGALAEAFDEPFADSSAIPTYLISQLARQHVKVALSGREGTSCSVGTTTTPGTHWRAASGRQPESFDRSSNVFRRRPARRAASTGARSAGCERPACRRSSATRPGSPCSRRRSEPSSSGARTPSSMPRRSSDPTTPRARVRTSWRG